MTSLIASVYLDPTPHNSPAEEPWPLNLTSDFWANLQRSKPLLDSGGAGLENEAADLSASELSPSLIDTMSQDDSLSPSPGPRSPQSSFGAIVAILLVVAVVGLSWVMGQRTGPTPPPSINQPVNPTIAPESPPPPREVAPPKQITTPAPAPAAPKPKPAETAASDRYKVRNLALKNQDGKVIYRGDMDLAPEIARIKEGDKLPFSHDGTVFQNREGRLPRKDGGYYHEWVVLTPGQSGPGPQRIITGKGGELYYTHDHYKTFQRLPDQ